MATVSKACLEAESSAGLGSSRSACSRDRIGRLAALCHQIESERTSGQALDCGSAAAESEWRFCQRLLQRRHERGDQYQAVSYSRLASRFVFGQFPSEKFARIQ